MEVESSLNETVAMSIHPPIKQGMSTGRRISLKFWCQLAPLATEASSSSLPIWIVEADAVWIP